MNTTVPNMIMDLTVYIVSKKRCSVCVDKMMETFLNSVETENEHIHILLTNKSVDVIDICEDIEEVVDIDTNVVTD